MLGCILGIVLSILCSLSGGFRLQNNDEVSTSAVQTMAQTSFVESTAQDGEVLHGA